MKRTPFSLILSAGLVLISAAFVPQAKAGESDHLTEVTFNQPVEIPGQVLGPGTYTLRLLDSSVPGGGYDYVVFADKADRHVYGIVAALPVYYDNPFSWFARPPEHTIITFEERASDSPQAIKDWFFPGKVTGEEFVYRKLPQAQTGSRNGQ